MSSAGHSLRGGAWLVATAIIALGSATAHAQATRKRARAPQGIEEAFSASPRKLLDAARGVTARPGSDVIYLLDQTHYTFGEDGRTTVRFYTVFKVLTASGASSYGRVGKTWAPWYQEQPTLRARVITPDGTAHALDPATISSSPVAESAHMYSDARELTAPLPAMAPGSVVELEIVRSERRPFSGKGAYTEGIGRSAPVQESRLVIDGPPSLRIHHAAYLLPRLEKTTERSATRTRWSFRHGPTEPLTPAEDNQPLDAPFYPHIHFSTGGSWAELAAEYRAIIDEQIAKGDIGHIDISTLTRRSSARATIDAALAFVHANVRYTGLELGEASFVPWTPAETWQRKYGDCKDQATLLVALLRRLGITAHVALLRAGAPRDIHPDMPDIWQFNHAIVYVPGATPLWIDPTVELARAGEVPIANSGRWALIIDSSTRALVRTPAAQPGDNVYLEERDIYLAEQGPARVVERTTLRGSFEQGYRSGYLDPDPAKVREQLQRYADTAYKGALSRYTASDSRDLSKPFVLQLDISDAASHTIVAHRSEIFVPAGGLLAFLPSELIGNDAEHEPRKNDLVIHRPYIHEEIHRIHLPPGFAPESLPAAERTELGKAVLTREARRSGDVVEIKLRFDSGATRLSAREVMAMRAAVQAFAESPAWQLVIQQQAMARLEAGASKEALAELRALAARYPARAYYRELLAEALLAAGMGEAAREQAEQAARLEPRRARAHQLLGWVLQHDMFGRRFGHGFDWKRSVAAYRKARKLAPGDVDIRAELAHLLEHDASGRRYGKGARLDEAIAEYLALRADGEHGMDESLLAALVRAGRLAEVRDLARSMSADEVRDGYLIAALSVTDGLAAATAEAGRMRARAGAQAELLAGAAPHLMLSRRHAEAAALMREALRLGGPSSARQTQQALLDRFKRYDPARATRDEPESLFYRLLHVLLEPPQKSQRALEQLLSRRARESLDPDELRDPDGQLQSMRLALDIGEVSEELLLDIIASLAELRVESAAPWGWRVRARFAQSQDELPAFFVVREGNGYRLLSSGTTTPLGLEALHLADKGDLEGARRWLDWASELVSPGTRGEAFSEHPFAELWRKGQNPGRAAIRAAAASLIEHGPAVRRALPILGECVRAGGAAALHCRHALITAHRALKQYPEALAEAEALAASHRDARALVMARGALLHTMKRHADLLALMDEWLAAHPGDGWAMDMQAEARAGLGDFAATGRIYEARMAGAQADASVYNNAAWATLFLGRPDDAAVEVARRAVSMTQRGNGPTLNTLAAVLAARGELMEASQLLHESMAVKRLVRPGPADWLVYGRIAEGYGLTRIARAAYGRVEAEELTSMSPHRLAAVWAARLGK